MGSKDLVEGSNTVAGTESRNFFADCLNITGDIVAMIRCIPAN